MAVELVIKIPEGLKKDFELEQWTALSCMEMKNALEKATPLPKGHGKIVDASEVVKAYAFEKKTNALSGDDDAFIKAINQVSTMIEADKESEDEV